MTGHVVNMETHPAGTDKRSAEIQGTVTNNGKVVNSNSSATNEPIAKRNDTTTHVDESNVSDSNNKTVNGGDPEKLRVFLVQTAQGLTPSSGGYKANYCLLRQIVANGRRGKDEHGNDIFVHEAAQICYGFEKEVTIFAEKARDSREESKFTEEDFTLVDPAGKKHTLTVNTFDDDEHIHNIAIRRESFDEAYPFGEFYDDIQAYLAIEPEGRSRRIDTEKLNNRIKTVIAIFARYIEAWKPTHVIFNDALTMKLTRHYPFSHSFKRVAIIHTVEQLPFGPFSQGIKGHCLNPKLERVMLRELDGIWAVSRSVQNYCTTWDDLDTQFFVHSSLTYMDAKTNGIPRIRHNVDKDEIGMVNPCPHKGLPILLALAEKLPHFKFVTWRSWGTDDKHVKQLQALGNVRIEDTTRDTDQIWDRIKILIAPSVWHEAWGIIVSEAQLRGIPTIASNAGGLPEAKINLPYSLPVNMITGNRHNGDGSYVVPEQSTEILELWKQKVELLMTDDDFYKRLAKRTGEEAHKWLRDLDPRAHEKWLLDMLKPKPDSGTESNNKLDAQKTTASRFGSSCHGCATPAEPSESGGVSNQE